MPQRLSGVAHHEVTDGRGCPEGDLFPTRCVCAIASGSPILANWKVVAMPDSVTHVPAVVVRSGRYPYLPACSCGWTYGCGYVADHAARNLAESHADGTLNR